MRNYGIMKAAADREGARRKRALVPDLDVADAHGDWPHIESPAPEMDCTSSYAFVWQVVWRFAVGALLVMFALAGIAKLVWPN